MWVHNLWPLILHYIIYEHFAHLWGQTVLPKWVHNLCPLILCYIIYEHFAHLWGHSVSHKWVHNLCPLASLDSPWDTSPLWWTLSLVEVPVITKMRKMTQNCRIRNERIHVPLGKKKKCCVALLGSKLKSRVGRSGYKNNYLINMI